MLTYRDTITRAATAFASWGALVAALRTGYIPTLHHEGRQLELGALIECAGHRVWWADGQD